MEICTDNSNYNIQPDADIFYVKRIAIQHWRLSTSQSRVTKMPQEKEKIAAKNWTEETEILWPECMNGKKCNWHLRS